MRNHNQIIKLASSSIILVALTSPILVALFANSYIAPFLDRCVEHGLHEIAIVFACATSALASWIAWKGYQSTGEVFQKYLAGAFLAFAIVYLPHGALTRTADSNIMLFLLFGPTSRLAMISLLAIGAAKFGQTDVSTRDSRHFFIRVTLGCIALCSVTALLAYSPYSEDFLLRGGIEASSAILAAYVVFKFYQKRREAYLMGFLAAAMYLFIQSSVVFLLARPWDIVWWMAHGIFAGGFLIISYAALTALQTRGKFYSSPSPVQNIMELMTVKAELERKSEAVRAATEQKSRFLANISHDLRTPLNGIIGLLEIIRQDKDPVAIKENIESLDQVSHSLIELIDDFLEYARIDASEVILSPSPTSIGELINQVEQTIFSQAKVKSIELHTIVSEEIKSAVVLLDKPRMGRILLNLLSNAIKFTDQGSVTLSVETRDPLVIDKDCRITFKIEDTGCGLTDKTKNNIFTPFSTSEKATNSNITGTGLGLSIVKRLVDLMEGDIEWRSQPNKGTVFEINLALKIVAINPKSSESLSNKKKKRDLCNLCNHLRGISVLIVDDSQLNLRVCSALLENAGASTVKVAGANAAIESIKHKLGNDSFFDLILMDIQMPEIDGIEATKMIRGIQGYKNTPIVALTGCAIRSIKEQAIAAGMIDFLEKPLNPDLLITKTCSLVGRQISCPRPLHSNNVIDLSPELN